MAAIGWSSDRRQERHWRLLGCGMVAAAAVLLLRLSAGNASGTTLLLATASVTVFAYLALFWTVPAVVLAKDARAGGIALVSSIGASGSAFSPALRGLDASSDRQPVRGDLGAGVPFPHEPGRALFLHAQPFAWTE
jgi:hypothetical protein